MPPHLCRPQKAGTTCGPKGSTSIRIHAISPKELKTV